MSDIILIAGVPGSGKTTFGEYLRDKKGFLHVDMEAFQGSELHSIWETAYRCGQFSDFLEALRDKSSKIVLTWGFHPNNLNIVEALKKAGAIIWFFEADEEAARSSFIKRNTVPIQAFEAQIRRLKERDADIKKVFGNNFVYSLHPDGKFEPFENLYAAITGC